MKGMCGFVGRGLFEGSFEKDPSSSPKTPQNKILLPMEESANNVLPFFVRERGVFAHRYYNTDFGLCPDRSWTSSKPRPTGCWRIVGVNFSLPPRGRGTAIAVEGACATLEFVLVLFNTRSPSVALRRQLPPGGSLKLVPLGRANTVRPYYSSCGAGYHREAISSTAGGYHPAARESLADRISLRGRPSPRPGEASKKSTSDRGRDQNLYCSTGARKLPLKA